MKVAVLGSTGMLGHMVCRLFAGEPGIVVRGLNREDYGSISPCSFNEMAKKLDDLLGDFDYVVNCIGAIKPVFDEAKSIGNLMEPVFVNAVFPHQLALWGELKGVNIIHITTDCVFSGAYGMYTEDDVHDALDEYGKSKSLGEPTNAMVIRTSIIGPEFGERKRSFLEWLKSENGKTIKGFTNHYWNGLTTLELADSLFQIIDHDVWQAGTYHLYSTDVTKYDMVKEIIDVYGLNIEVDPHETSVTVDRRLRTVEDLNDFVQPLSFHDMVCQMREIEVKCAK